MFYGSLHAVVHAFDIYAEDPLEIALVSVFQSADVRDPRAVDKNVEAAFTHDLFKDCLDLITARDVALVGSRLAAGLNNLSGNRSGLRNVDIQNVDARDRKSTRLNSSHVAISYAVFCLKKK